MIKLRDIILEAVPKHVLDSFDVHDELNQQIWNGTEIKPEIRKQLLIIAKEFFDSLDLPPNVRLHDVTLTGSISNYNWSQFSDIDLHLIIDFSQVDENTTLVKDYFLSKKSLWNQKHNINVHGFPVEVYVENIGDLHIASGLYSILKDAWITRPPKKNVVIDKDDIKTKAEGYLAHEKHLNKLLKDKKYKEVIKMVDDIKSKLKTMRTAGLQKTGEFGVENLAFKILRRTPFIQNINNLQVTAYDKMRSIS